MGHFSAVQNDEEEIKKLKAVEAEKFLAYGLLANCDKQQHGNLVKALNNTYTFREDNTQKRNRKVTNI